VTAPKPKDELVRRPKGAGRAAPTRSICVDDSAWQLIRTLADKRGLAVGAYLTELAKDDATRALGGSPKLPRISHGHGPRR
jgi:hypothetical protein